MKSIATLKLDKGWARLSSALSITSRKKVTKACDIAVERAALVAVKLLRAEIQQGTYERNADLTIAIKGSTKPLVDKGRLFQSIGHQRIKRGTYFVGVLKSKATRMGKSEGGIDYLNIARIIHDGATIPVTAKMRAMFKALWWATRDKKSRGAGETWKRMPISKLRSKRARYLAQRAYRRKATILPLSPGTTAIRIPSRPFVRNVFERSSTKSRLRNVFFHQGIKKVLQEIWTGKVSAVKGALGIGAPREFPLVDAGPSGGVS